MHLFVKLDEERARCRFAKKGTHKYGLFGQRMPSKSLILTDNKTLICYCIILHVKISRERLRLSNGNIGKRRRSSLLFGSHSTLLLLYYRGPMQRDCSNSEKWLTYQGMKNRLLEIAETIAAKPGTNRASDNEEKGQGLWGWIKSKMS